MHLKAKRNYYQQELGDLFDKAPKAVCAAIAVSALTTGGDYLDEAQQRFLAEWWALYDNKIVTQKPPRPAVPSDE